VIKKEITSWNKFEEKFHSQSLIKFIGREPKDTNGLNMKTFGLLVVMLIFSELGEFFMQSKSGEIVVDTKF
jgi:hypothetical protein